MQMELEQKMLKVLPSMRENCIYGKNSLRGELVTEVVLRELNQQYCFEEGMTIRAVYNGEIYIAPFTYTLLGELQDLSFRRMEQQIVVNFPVKKTPTTVGDVAGNKWLEKYQALSEKRF